MAASQHQEIHLFSLPPEIRNKIYELVFHDNDSDSTVCPFILQCSPGKRKYGYSLTQTCHQIRDETLHMWHASSKLLFAMRRYNMKHYINWLQRRPDEVFESIRRIQLEDYQHCRVELTEQHPWFCRSAILVNLTKKAPVMWRRDRRCLHCPEREVAVERVSAVVRTCDWKNGRWFLTREKLEEIFEAAAWEI